MRWLSYFILAYVALGCQLALASRGYMDVKKATPNLVLLVVIYVAVNAPREAGLMGAFLMGLMQDLLTLYPLGTWATTYGLVAMFVISTQEFVYREHPLTHFSLALTGGLICGTLLTIHDWVYPKLHGGSALDGGRIVGQFTGVIYTALLAPVVLGVLQRMRRAFSFRGRMRNKCPVGRHGYRRKAIPVWHDR